MTSKDISLVIGLVSTLIVILLNEAAMVSKSLLRVFVILHLLSEVLLTIQKVHETFMLLILDLLLCFSLLFSFNLLVHLLFSVLLHQLLVSIEQSEPVVGSMELDILVS